MKIELLAPAGNLEKLKIAIRYGADAVYIAGRKFGLRSAAGNFSSLQLEEAIRFAHQQSRKVYLTVNSYLHDHELAELPEYIRFLDTIRPDAIIASDAGVIEVISQNSSIPIHLSTQASVLNSYSAEVWKRSGIQRIVLGRETSIREAVEIRNKASVEVEMFVHGAMCMSISGRCAMSTYIAGRDANRGGCIQNCRFRYSMDLNESLAEKHYFMSSKDLNGMDRIPEFIDQQIDSIKIEGRMKSNLYIATTVRAYRQAIDQYASDAKAFDFESLKNELLHIPHRGYTNASLNHPADKTSIYNNHKADGSDYEMAGMVLSIDQKQQRVLFQSKNKLLPGENVEILPHQGDIIEHKVETIDNLSGQSLSVAQPGTIFWLPLREGMEEGNVARKKITPVY